MKSLGAHWWQLVLVVCLIGVTSHAYAISGQEHVQTSTTSIAKSPSDLPALNSQGQTHAASSERVPWESIAAGIASVAALITAIVALSTLREMRRQREHSYRPHLVIADKRVVGLAVHRDSESRRADHWVEDELEAQTSEEIAAQRTYHLDLHNVGFGAAVNLEAEWSFDVWALRDWANQVASTDPPKIVVVEDESFYSIGIDGYFEMLSRIEGEIQRAASLLPDSANEKGLRIHLPYLFQYLASVAFGELSKRVDTRDAEPVGWPEFALDLCIDYEDVAGTPCHRVFEIKLEVESVSGAPMSNGVAAFPVFHGGFTAKQKQN